MAATKDNPTVRRVGEVGLYNGQLFASYFPYGKGVEPMFNARIDPEQAARIPAHQSLQAVEQIDQQCALTLAQYRQPTMVQDGQNGPSIGARTM